MIYSECFAITTKVKDLEHNEYLWDCFYSILSIESSDIKDSNWSKFDEVMHALLHEFGFENNPKLCILLFYQVLKFSAIGTGIEIDSHVKFEDHSPNYQLLKDISSKKENIRTMRWIKELMATFIRESTKMLMDPKDSLILINVR